MSPQIAEVLVVCAPFLALVCGPFLSDGDRLSPAQCAYVAAQNAGRSQELTKLLRQGVPGANVTGMVSTSRGITLRGKVSSQEDREVILRLARAFGAGSPSMMIFDQIEVDPASTLATRPHQ